MTIKEQLDADIKTAMFAQDKVRKELLKFIKGQIQYNEGKQIVMDDAAVCSLIKKQIENLNITPTQTAQQEIEILKAYLPQLMSENEVATVVDELIGGGANNMGAIMKHFNTNLRGRVDNAMVSRIVKEKLQ